MDPKLRAYFQKIGRKGGKARVRNQTPAERRKSAQKAVRARWAARKRSERAFWKGIGPKKRRTETRAARRKKRGNAMSPKKKRTTSQHIERALKNAKKARRLMVRRGASPREIAKADQTIQGMETLRAKKGR